MLNPGGLEMCARSEQFAYSVLEWLPRYWDEIPAFKSAERFWLILDPHENNSLLLRSLCSDPRMREKLWVVRNDVLAVVGKAFHYLKAESDWGAPAAWDFFQTIVQAVPMPGPNCVRELEALLKPPAELEKPMNPIGGGYATYGGVPSGDLVQDYYPEERHKVDSGDRSCGFAF